MNPRTVSSPIRAAAGWTMNGVTPVQKILHNLSTSHNASPPAINWSELARDPKAAAQAVDSAGEVTLVRRGEADLTLMRADRRSDVREAGRTTARLLQELLANADPARVGDALMHIYPWLSFLPGEGRSKFVTEYAETLHACADLDVWVPLARVIREWKATAAIHADPALHALLTDPDTAGDFGPVMPPEVADAGEE